VASAISKLAWVMYQGPRHGSKRHSDHGGPLAPDLTPDLHPSRQCCGGWLMPYQAVGQFIRRYLTRVGHVRTTQDRHSHLLGVRHLTRKRLTKPDGTRSTKCALMAVDTCLSHRTFGLSVVRCMNEWQPVRREDGGTCRYSATFLFREPRPSNPHRVLNVCQTSIAKFAPMSRSLCHRNPGY